MTLPKLDFKDRIILANQCRILQKVDPDNESEYRRALEILDNGYESEYGTIGGILIEPVPENVCEEVHSILGLYRSLSNGYKQLSDKTGIDAKDVEFRGFDGNNESDHLSYAQFLASEGKYEESRVVNSHSQVLGMYRRMLAEFEQAEPKYPLEKADIQRILAARIHPSQR